MGIKRGYVMRRIVKVGNSIGITIPKEFLNSCGVSVGSIVVLSVKDNKLSIKKVKINNN